MIGGPASKIVAADAGPLQPPGSRLLINFTAARDDFAEGLYRQARQGIGR